MILTVNQLIAEMARQTATIGVEVALAETHSAHLVEAEAKSRAPVDTGRLRNSITADGNEVGPTVDYAVYVEFGTSDTPPQPFMWPAADVVAPVFALEVLEAGDF